MRECIKESECEVIVTESLKDAIDISKNFDAAVFIAGSLYLVGEAVSLFKKNEKQKS